MRVWGRGGPGCTRTLGPGKGRCELRRGSRRRQFMEERLFTGGHFPGVRGEGGSRGASVPGVGLGRGRVGGTGAHGASEQAGGAPQKSDLASFGDGAVCDYWFNPPPPPPPPCVAGVIRPHSVPGHTASWSPGRPLAHATPPGAPPVCLVAGRGRGEAEWGPSLERGEPDSSEGAPALGPAPRPHPLQGGWGRVGPVSGRALQSCLRWEGPPCSSLTAVLEAEGPRSFPSGLARRRAVLSPLGKCQSLRGRERAERVPLERAMSGLLWGRASGPFGCLLYG